MNLYDLAQELRTLRKQQRVSQTQMAEHLHISRATLSAFESGRSGDIGLRKVMAMADYLGVELCLRDKSPFPTFEELRDAH